MATKDERDLMLERVVDVSPELVFKAWTTPKHLMPWFCPKPYRTVECEIDLKPGGKFFAQMVDPNGNKLPAEPGCYLEVVPNRKLVFTDAYTGDWNPKTSGKPFMTGIITLDDEDGKTRYTARVRHWSAEDKKTHEDMGFHTGWGICTDQLAALAKTI